MVLTQQVSSGRSLGSHGARVLVLVGLVTRVGRRNKEQLTRVGAHAQLERADGVVVQGGDWEVTDLIQEHPTCGTRQLQCLPLVVVVVNNIIISDYWFDFNVML